MTLDTQVEQLFGQYYALDRVKDEFEIDPSTDNYQLREAIKDPQGKGMITQQAGLVKKQLESNITDTTNMMDSIVGENGYSNIRNEFYNPLDESLKNLAYLEIAKNVLGRFLTKEEADGLSNDLQEILGLIGITDSIKLFLAKEKYDDAIKLMGKVVTNGKADLAYHYNAIGQKGNVEAIGKQLMQIQTNRAVNKMSDEVKAEIDRVVADKSAYGVAGAEIYKTHKAYEQMQEANQELALAA